MKNISKRLLTFALVFAMLFSMCGNAFAVDANRTYSIGCKFVGEDYPKNDDFTPNVNSAYEKYSAMPYYDHHKILTPTRTNMLQKSGNGLRVICNKVVFLNSHGNYDSMIFKAGSGAEYLTGVYYGEDYTSPKTWTKYAGIKDVDTDMNYVKLITFAGCLTANADVTTYNLAYNARAEGATTSVGFKKNIISRFSTGPNWCRTYNEYLKQGHTVASALALASNYYGGGCDMDSYHIYGSTGTTLTAKKTTSSSSIKETESLQSTRVAGIQDIEEIFNKNINIPVSTENMKDAYGININEYDMDLNKIIESIMEINSDFNVNDYKLTVNIYSPETKSGIINFAYCIGENILTNKVYTVCIENNVAKNIFINKAFVTNTDVKQNNTKSQKIASLDTVSNENKLDLLVKNFELKNKNEIVDETSISGQVVSHDNKYFYDYYSDTLFYNDTVFYEDPQLDNCIVDKSITKYLRGTENEMLKGVEYLLK